MTLKVVEVAHRTDTGRQRNANEDAFYARAPVFAVADGMGGAQAGEVASRVAAEAFESAGEHGDAPERYLSRVVTEANERIHELAQSDASRSGMGTTLTAALIRDDEVSLAHVGDSRAYVLRDGELKRLTSDHSLVEELRRQGRLTEAQAEEHPQRSIITRALGPEPDVEVDTMTVPARPGDVFVLCSDGLTTMVPEARIARILERSKSLESAVSRLVREANEGGGRDNITVVAFRLADAGAAAPKEQPTLIAPPAQEAEPTAARRLEAGSEVEPRILAQRHDQAPPLTREGDLALDRLRRVRRRRQDEDYDAAGIDRIRDVRGVRAGILVGDKRPAAQPEPLDHHLHALRGLAIDRREAEEHLRCLAGGAARRLDCGSTLHFETHPRE